MTPALPDVGGDVALPSLEPVLAGPPDGRARTAFRAADLALDARLAAAFGAKGAGDAVVRARDRAAAGPALAPVSIARRMSVVAAVGGCVALHPCADVDIAVIASTEIDGDNRERPGQHYFQAKLAEQAARYCKFDDAFGQIDPNVQENPGGLRDIQVIAWVVNRALRPPRSAPPHGNESDRARSPGLVVGDR